MARCLPFLLLSAFTWLVATGSGGAAELPQPQGRVILTVGGTIAATNGDAKASFDRDMLAELGLRTVRTSTTWTDGVKTFEGVLARDLLARVGAKGSKVTATALNDYAIDIPMSDFETYDVLLALRMDGKDLLPRDKGPVWIVYPRDEKPELRDPRFDSRWVWQLKALQVR